MLAGVSGTTCHNGTSGRSPIFDRGHVRAAGTRQQTPMVVESAVFLACGQGLYVGVPSPPHPTSLSEGPEEK